MSEHLDERDMKSAERLAAFTDGKLGGVVHPAADGADEKCVEFLLELFAPEEDVQAMQLAAMLDEGETATEEAVIVGAVHEARNQGAPPRQKKEKASNSFAPVHALVALCVLLLLVGILQPMLKLRLLPDTKNEDSPSIEETRSMAREPAPYEPFNPDKPFSEFNQHEIRSIVFELVENGDLAGLKWFADNGADLNFYNFWSNGQHASVSGSPLHVAAATGQLEIAAWLVEQGLDVNAADTRLSIAATPLGLASTPEMAEFLLSRGAKLEQLSGGRTPLEVSLMTYHAETAKYLLGLGADIRDSAKQTPLVNAVVGPFPEVARLLLDRGADPDGAWSDSGYPPLSLAARQGNLEICRLLLDRGANPNIEDQSGLRPLQAAAREGFGELCADLIGYGATVEDGGGTLWDAVIRRDEGAVRRMASAGAGLDKEDPSGYTALFYAAVLDNAPVCGLLLDAGAEVDYQALKSQETALMQAARKGGPASVEILLQRGADPNLGSSGMSTALHTAARRGHEEIVSLLLAAGADPNARSDRGDRPLHSAIFSMTDVDHAMACVGLLLDAGANIEEQGSYLDYTPLGLACYRQSPEMVRLLLERGADPDNEGTGGGTPLARLVGSAPYPEQLEIARLLLEAGAKTDDVGIDGFNVLDRVLRLEKSDLAELFREFGLEPSEAYLAWKQMEEERQSNKLDSLNEAIAYGKLEEARRLIEQGADVNAVSMRNIGDLLYGNYPLEAAIAGGNLEAVRLLLESGADVDGPEKREADDADKPTFHQPPLKLAIQYDRPEIFGLLLDSGATIDRGEGSLSLLSDAVSQNRVDIVRILLEAGADPNQHDEFFSSPLHVAAQQSRQSVRVVGDRPEPPLDASLRMLLEAGADLDLKSYGGRTALYYAAQMGNLPAVEALLEYGADLELATDSQNTPLHAAAGRSSAEIVKRLLEAGARVDAVNEDGRTPLMLAANAGRSKNADLLIQHGGIADAADSPVDAAIRGDIATFENYTGKTSVLNRRDAAGRTALHYATALNRVELVKLLLEKGVDPDPADNDGVTPLMRGVRNERETCVRLLAEAGADVNRKDADGTPLLHTATQKDDISLMRVLLDNGADFEARDATGRTALFPAAAWDVDAVRLLAERGADLKARDHLGRTALWHSVGSWKGEQAMRWLVEKGLDINALDNEGKSVRDFLEGPDGRHRERALSNVIELGGKRGTELRR